MRGRRQLRDRVDCGGGAVVREIAADDEEDRCARLDAVTLEDLRPVGTQSRVEAFAVDRVVDDGELRLGEREPRANLVADHRRFADDGAQPRAREEALLDPQQVSSVRGAREPKALGRRRVLRPLLESDRVDAVARAVDVAAEHRLVRFDEARHRPANRAARGVREAPVAPEPADVERIADHRFDQLQARLRPRPRIQRNGDVALEQRFERPFGSALDGAVRMVILPDDRKAHRRSR